MGIVIAGWVWSMSTLYADVTSLKDAKVEIQMKHESDIKYIRQELDVSIKDIQSDLKDNSKEHSIILQQLSGIDAKVSLLIDGKVKEEK
jgi:fructose-1,6-bisphosphatase/sedoheptulose 1,7-bisphosphatase-like protein